METYQIFDLAGGLICLGLGFYFLARVRSGRGRQQHWGVLMAGNFIAGALMLSLGLLHA